MTQAPTARAFIPGGSGETFSIQMRRGADGVMRHLAIGRGGRVAAEAPTRAKLEAWIREQARNA